MGSPATLARSTDRRYFEHGSDWVSVNNVYGKDDYQSTVDSTQTRLSQLRRELEVSELGRD